MAGLFKNRIIKEDLERFEIPDFNAKMRVIKNWKAAYDSGELKNKTETQCEQSFNNDFFIKVLGYEPFPREVYTIQPKDRVDSGGGQIPDATLGYFAGKEKRVIAVVEIKDANTSLDKSQHREGNLSPIQQAFKYKPQFKDCGFVIATNFFEIRLFRDNQLDYEYFTLATLADPRDDYFEFRKFYYLLSAQNFVVDKGETKTEKLLAAIRIEQEEITSKFYSKYKKLREDLIKDIVKNNRDIKRQNFYTHVVEKAQKIVDRVVLICFFEDAGLLPEGKLIEVVEYAQKGALREPVWETIKKFFTAVDEGSERLGVPHGYNGELFKIDEELNSLKLSDEVCKQFVDLGKFDFDEDLSVNILGHIFEQSITDLERLKKFADEKEIVENKRNAKRKKDGIYYTPEYVVDYIVKNSLGKYLEDKEQSILSRHGLDSARIKKDSTYNKRLLESYLEYEDELQKIKILDPACGSGAFLVRAFDFLLAEHQRVGKILDELQGASGLFHTQEYIKKILQDNLFGVDLNPESVEITKLSLWLKSASRGQKLVNLNKNIRCGNSLVDNEEVSSRAFNWTDEFSEILNSGGFDVVIGNPPYLNYSSKNSPLKSDETLRREIEYVVSKRPDVVEGCVDLYKFFFDLSLSLLKIGGYLGFITPNTFIKQEKYADLRNLIAKEQSSFVIDIGSGVFPDATVITAITVIGKGVGQGQFYFQIKSDNLKNFTSSGDPSLLKPITARDEIEIIDGGLLDSKKYNPMSSVAIFKEGEHLSRSTLVAHRVSGSIGVVDSKNMHRYEVLRAAYFSEPQQKYKTTSGSRAVIRKTGDSIFAALTTDEESYVIQNLYQVLELKPPYTSGALVGILNSKLLTYLYQNSPYGQRGRPMAQLRKSGLDKLPVPQKPEAEVLASIDRKVRTIAEKELELRKMLNNTAALIKVEFGIEFSDSRMESIPNFDSEQVLLLLPKRTPTEQKQKFLDFFDNATRDIKVYSGEINSLKSAIDQDVSVLYDLSRGQIEEVERVVQD